MGFNIKIGKNEFYYTWSEIIYGLLVVVAAVLVFLGFFLNVFTTNSEDSAIPEGTKVEVTKD